jgi:hypothetical protein
MGNSDSRNIPSDKEKLLVWAKQKGCIEPVFQEGVAPRHGKRRAFAFTSCPLLNLNFTDHKFNPRTPNPGKINELVASIASLTLLTPLTCAYLESNEDQVVLLDGRHRFSALEKLEEEDKDWARNAMVDLKIYYELEKSDVYMLATYLNKTRKALAKGEYYKFIVEIYDSKYEEIVRRDGKEPTETQVFKEISARELTNNKNEDLSVGRIVGITAFDDEQGDSWFPYVGLKQQDKIGMGDSKGSFCPLTAGNLATLLKHLCATTPYPDTGAQRSIEITNTLILGEYFRKTILRPVRTYDVATGTTIACKHWPLDALGKLIETEWKNAFLSANSNGKTLLSNTDIKWERINKFLEAYFSIMEEQAFLTNQFRKGGNRDIVGRIWSYQTQTEQIIPKLRGTMIDKLNWLRSDKGEN